MEAQSPASHRLPILGGGWYTYPMFRFLCISILAIVGFVPFPLSSAQSEQTAVQLMSSETGCSGCIWLQVSGEIDERTEEAVSDALTQFGFVDEVHIDSGGGNLQAALRLGALFRDLRVRTVVAGIEPLPDPRRKGLATVTDGDCMSACVYMLAGGVERLAIEGSRIGVHRFRLDGSEPVDDPLSIGQTQTGQLVAFLSVMDIDPIVISYSSLFDAGEIGLVDVDTALKTSLLTMRPVNIGRLSRASSAGISNSSLDPFGDEDRVPPSDRKVCNEPILTSEGTSQFDHQRTIAGNRFWRKMCNLYFDGPHSQERWDVIYEALQDPPMHEQTSSLAEFIVETELRSIELKQLQRR